MSNTSMRPLLGHDQVWNRFQKSYLNGRLASTYLFVGPPGIGKRTVAIRLAQTLLCEQLGEAFTACEQCSQCKLLLAGNHPDLITIAKPEGKNFIPLELLIGDREHRRRAGLCHDISLTPYYGRRKVAVIDDADQLNIEGANCLLKTLEEPPDKSILILIGTSEHRQLPTILSRSQIIRFRSLSREQLADLLRFQELSGEVEFEQLVAASAGSIHQALKLDDKELYEFRTRLFAQLASADPAEGDFAKAVCDFVDNRHKDAAARREEYSLLADMAISFFELVIRISVDTNSDAEPTLAKSCEDWLGNVAQSDIDAAELGGDCVERTEQFKFQISANLASANVVPAWLNDLGAFARLEKQWSCGN